MCDMAVGAGNRAGLEAPAEHQRLIAVEAIGLAVGPELALQIVGGNLVAQEEGQRIVLIAIARPEADEEVGLVPMAVGAGVEDSARLR